MFIAFFNELRAITMPPMDRHPGEGRDPDQHDADNSMFGLDFSRY